MSHELLERRLEGQVLTTDEEQELKDFLETFDGNDLLEKTWINAAEEGDTETLEILLDLGVDINLETSNGVTALTSAADNDQEDCIKFLLAKKANINQPDEWGNTALMLAASNGWQNCLEILLENKADLHLIDSYGSTALDLAEANEDEESIQLLLIYHIQGDSYEDQDERPAKRLKSSPTTVAAVENDAIDAGQHDFDLSNIQIAGDCAKELFPDLE
jgi:ankyrin repeat protein